MQNHDRVPTVSGGATEGVASAASESGTEPSVEAIEQWLVAYVANLLDIPEGRVATTASFDEFGLDSIAAVVITTELGKWLGREVELSQAAGAPTIASVARLAAGRA